MYSISYGDIILRNNNQIRRHVVVHVKLHIAKWSTCFLMPLTKHSLFFLSMDAETKNNREKKPGVKLIFFFIQKLFSESLSLHFPHHTTTFSFKQSHCNESMELDKVSHCKTNVYIFFVKKMNHYIKLFNN